MYYLVGASAEVRNRTRVFGRMIDLRASGGYVVAPPSIHLDTERVYQWCPWDYFAAEEIPFFDPEWITPTKVALAATTVPASWQTNAPIRNGPAYISCIRAVSGHNGHASTHRATASLRDAGMPPEEALAALIAWNETNCEPPWTVAELQHKVEDVFNFVSPGR